MLRTGILIGLMALTATFAAIPIAASAQEQTPSTSAQEPTPRPSTPPDPPTRRGKMDPRHPLHIGANYYPKESLKRREQGRCILNLYINADGSVAATQLLKSTGFPRLDTACIESVIDVPVLPAKVNGTPVAGWSEFKINWQLGPPQFTQYPPLDRSAVPRVADDYELQGGKNFYPEAARAKHERGYCVVRTTVDSSGSALNPSIIRSTGSVILDKACLAAVTSALFTPELQDGRPVADSTDIAIYW
jgi:TonB family protein